jgi:hypothetical protein
MDKSASRAESQHVVAANLVEISLLTACDEQIDGDAITQVGPARFLPAPLNVLSRGLGDALARRGAGNTGRRSSVQRSNGFEGVAVLHLDHGSVSNGDIFADLDWRALATAARTEIVGRSFNRNGAMILRELHIDERKVAVTCVDACDESVVGHIRFPRKA